MSVPVSFFNPFVRPIKYKAGPKCGFILFPHSDSVPEGWGDPTEDEFGTPIVPGTEGGPNPCRLLAYSQDGETWKSYRSPAWQVAGPIDWKGPLTDPTNTTSKRYVISYWGPNTRHFNFGQFEYGSDAKHQEIYMLGMLLAIAPLPVLGAARREFTYTRTVAGVTETVTEEWLVVMLRSGTMDECWARPMPIPMRYEAVTDEIRFNMMQGQSDTYPDGWVMLGAFPQQLNAYAPETPWFFNESCTEARTVRRTSKTFDDGSGVEVTEDVFIEYMVRITLSEVFKNALFTNLGLDPTHRFDYLERTEKYRQSWLYNDDPDEEWQEDIIETRVTCDGKMLVAVDYDGDQLLRGFIEQDATRAFYQYWMLGVGANNSGRVDGEMVPRTEAGILINPLPGEHRTGPWITAIDYMILHVLNVATNTPVMRHYIQYIAAMSQTMFSTGIDDNADRILYFWEGLFSYLHFLDMREPMLVGASDGVSNYYGGYPNYHHADLTYREWMQGDSSNHPYVGTDRQHAFSMYMESMADNLVWWAWDRTEMLSWPTTISQTVSRITYRGGWLDPNAGEALYQPYFWDNMRAWYQNLEMAPKLRIWPLDHMLGGPNTYKENGVFGVDEKGNCLAHYEYEDPETAEPMIASGLLPDGNLAEAMSYGDKFSPGGVF